MLQVLATAVGPAMPENGKTAKIGKFKMNQLMYGTAHNITGSDIFSTPRNFIRFINRDTDMAAALALEASQHRCEHKQLESEKRLSKQQFHVEDMVALVQH